MNYIVYKTTNIVNGKIYIGVHRTNPDIFDGYIGCGVSHKDSKKCVNKGFPKAVLKYGYKNFKRETLFIFPGTEEGKKAAYAKEAEIVNKDFVKSSKTYNLVLGGKISMGENNKKEIAQYTISGKFIRSWSSITEAQIALNIPNINQNLLGISKYSGNFQWKYYTDTNDIPPVQIKEKSVYQFDLQGNLIKSWKSITEASKQFTNSQSAKSAISRNCRNIVNTAYGYYWSFKRRFDYSNKNCKAVAKYDDDGHFLECYNSVKEAALANGYPNANIGSAISGKVKRSCGYRWRYYYGNKGDIAPLR